jgi:hypothetical protein
MARISVPLTAEEEATLIARARARGVSVEILVRNAILEVVTGASEVPPHPRSTERRRGQRRFR